LSDITLLKINQKKKSNVIKLFVHIFYGNNLSICSWRYVIEEREKKIKWKLILYSECSLDCGNGSRCLETKIPHLPEICACSDGTYTNSTCSEIELEDENNITSINAHGLLE
jgi:hypothetical protein